MAQVRTVERILRAWDPIGVLSVEGGPDDEYDSYAPHIVTLINSGCSVGVLAKHLSHTRTVNIGLPENYARDIEFAAKLIEELRSSHSEGRS
jgi:hypothetical protein